MSLTPDPTSKPVVDAEHMIAPNPQINNPLSAVRPGEVNICEIKRHPFGLFAMYGSFGALLIIILALIVVGPQLFTTMDSKTIYEVGIAAFILVFIMAAVFGTIARVVYNGNRWIITSDSLTQVQQKSLFDKQSSQLSLGNLEDVTVRQDGILAHMFNFGTVNVETAGERAKFVMIYCPNPNFYAQKILAAREDFEQGRREGVAAGAMGAAAAQQPYMDPRMANQMPQQQPLPPQNPYQQQ